jgi:putative photosynthetic complex assembly protein
MSGNERDIQTQPGPDTAPRGAGPRPGPRPRVGRPFPRPLGVGIVLLLSISFVAVAFGRYTEIGTVRNPQTAPLAIRDLVFVDLPEGEIAVKDARTDETIHVIHMGEDGFIRGSMRGFARERKTRGKPADAAFRLIRWDDGTTTLADTSTGQVVYLNAFGPTNAAAYERFLPGLDHALAHSVPNPFNSTAPATGSKAP